MRLGIAISNHLPTPTVGDLAAQPCLDASCRWFAVATSTPWTPLPGRRPFLVTVLLRYNFDISQVRWFSLLVVCFVAAVLQLLASWQPPLCQAGVRHPGFCGLAFEGAGNGRNHVGRIRAASPKC